METFIEFVDEQAIINLLIKERAKCAANGSLSHEKPSAIALDTSRLMPPRNKWHRIRKSSRSQFKDTRSLNEQALRSTVRSDMRKFKGAMDQAPEYLQELNKFTREMIRTIKSDEPLDFSHCIKIIPKFKETTQDGTYLFRPITIYTSLKEKLLISLSCKYLMEHLDHRFHEEILSYRPARSYHGEENRVTSGEDAIFLVQDFIHRHPGQELYVAECDIQKFFDIINHDVVMTCFKKLIKGTELESSFSPVERILKAYLDSYSYSKTVMSYNNDLNFWKENNSSAKQARKGKCIFKWLKDDDLLSCYSNDELESVRNTLGISQGGALSCLIANVVMNDVDSGIVQPEDKDQLYVRFGDDILMMHTDKSKCEEMLESYRKSLLEHRLCYHPFAHVSDLKDGDKLTSTYWHTKSKKTFRWGLGKGDAAEWIGFVGYEIKYNGDVRLRQSTLNKKFGDINKKYHSCIIDEQPRNVSSFLIACWRRMKYVSYALEQFPALNVNPQSIAQAKSLDRYRHHKIQKLQSVLESKYSNQVTEYALLHNFSKTLLTEGIPNNPYSYYRTLQK